MKLFEQFAERFRAAARDARQIVEGILEELQKERLPRQEAIGHLNAMFQVLESAHSGLVQEAKNYVPDASEEASVPEYLDMIRASELAKREAFLAMAGEVLRQFMRIHSEVELYQRALEPHRQRAVADMQSLAEQEIDCEKIGQDVHAYRLFLEALDRRIEDTTESDRFWEQLEEVYSSTVMRGLYAQKYYLSEEELPAEEVETEEIPEEI
ncbi:MAG: hypothetical protein ACI4U2_02775, partial [Christensenellaceae bacterium]